MSTTTLPTDPPTETRERRTGRHPVNVGHLVMGIAFLGIVGAWAFVQADVVEGSHIRWLLPVPWVLAGLAGLIATAVAGSRRWSTRQVGWIAPSPAPDTTTDTTLLGTDDHEPPEPSEDLR